MHRGGGRNGVILLLQPIALFLCHNAFAGAPQNTTLAPQDVVAAASVYPLDQGEYRLTLYRAPPAGAIPTFTTGSYPVRLSFIGQPALVLPACGKAGVARANPPAPAACLDASDTSDLTLEILLTGIATGTQSFTLDYADGSATNMLTTMFAPHGAGMIRLAAGVATVILLVVVLLLLASGPLPQLATGRKPLRLLRLIIDNPTCTYSLSKLQLYVWLVAGASAYLYLFTAKWLAQGNLSLPDVPESILTLAGISITTSVAAIGVTGANGGKGSGQFGPTGADLITSGGDVAPERVQQLLWTLIAAPAFLVVAYASDPATMSSIHDLPNAFLGLMGISSAGYVGGKIARGSGPKVNGVVAVVAGNPPYMTLTVTGSDIQVAGLTFMLADMIRDKQDHQLPATILADGSTINSTGVATKLALAIPAAGLRQVPSPDGSWGYRFALVAEDGERAEWEF